MTRAPRRSPSGRPSDTPGLTARQGALALLESVLSDGTMLEDAGTSGTGAERAEARGLADLTLRRLGQIDQILAQFVDRAPKGAGQQILRLMTAELIFAQTPPHAAVDLGVRLAQAGRGTARLSGLINAVGRKVAATGAEIAARQDAAGMNTPPWLAKRLVADWGTETARAIAEAHLTPAPHDLTFKQPGDRDAMLAEIGGASLSTGSLRVAGRPQITTLPGYAQGAWWVQDAAAALPARMIPHPEGKRVLDLCAAPGGKTLQLAALGARVTALDLSEARLQRLAENLARTDLDAELVVADALGWEPDECFDAILLDAPCSATGTIRRHPDLPHRMDGKGLDRLADLQTKLLDRAFAWLKPGGFLVYSTCSLLKAEGEGQAGAFLGRTPGANASAGDIPAAFTTAEGYLRTRPDHWSDLGGLDGFFAARFQRGA